jgi:hypothetical protein
MIIYATAPCALMGGPNGTSIIIKLLRRLSSVEILLLSLPPISSNPRRGRRVNNNSRHVRVTTPASKSRSFVASSPLPNGPPPPKVPNNFVLQGTFVSTPTTRNSHGLVSRSDVAIRTTSSFSDRAPSWLKEKKL